VSITVRCSDCCLWRFVEPETCLLSICRDDAALSRFHWHCSKCGPRLSPIDAEAFHKLDAEGVTVTYWPLSERGTDSLREHQALMREWSARLPEVLEQILSEAS